MAEIEEQRQRKEEEAARRRELARQQNHGENSTGDAMEHDIEFEQFDAEENELLDSDSTDENSMQVVSASVLVRYR